MPFLGRRIMKNYLWSALFLAIGCAVAIWFLAGQRPRPLTLAERIKLKAPKAESQVNNVKVQRPLQYPDHLSPLILKESEANEHVELRPPTDDSPSSTGDVLRLTQGPIVDTPVRRMPYADDDEPVAGSTETDSKTNRPRVMPYADEEEPDAYENWGMDLRPGPRGTPGFAARSTRTKRDAPCPGR